MTDTGEWKTAEPVGQWNKNPGMSHEALEHNKCHKKWQFLKISPAKWVVHEWMSDCVCVNLQVLVF